MLKNDNMIIKLRSYFVKAETTEADVPLDLLQDLCGLALTDVQTPSVRRQLSVQVCQALQQESHTVVRHFLRT